MRIVALMTSLMFVALAVTGCAASRTASRDPTPLSPARATRCSGAVALTGGAGSPACTGFGRSYSRQDIERTGAITTGDALALLDPSISVRR